MKFEEAYNSRFPQDKQETASSKEKNESHDYFLNDGDLDVLLQTRDYIVINKPAYLRMDGDFSKTVEKKLDVMLAPSKAKWVCVR